MSAFLLLFFVLSATPAKALLLNLNLLQAAVLGVDWIATNASRVQITGLNELRLHDGYVETQSKAFQFANANAVNLSFDVYVPFNLLGLIGSAPNPGENLRVDYLASDNSWKTLTTFVPDTGFLGLISLGGAFHYSSDLPVDAYHDNFRIRYVMLGGGVNLFDLLGDNWYVSGISLTADVVPNQPDHYRFTYTGPALTCNPQPVQIEACEDAACSSYFTGAVSLTLAPSGWVGGNTVSFSGGSTIANLAHTTAGTVNISVSSATPAISGSANLCVINGGTASTSCPLTFADSGFLVDVPDFMARRSTSATIKAVRKDNTTQACVPAFANVAKSVSLWSDYLSPDDTGRVVNWPVSVNGFSVGTSQAAATAQALTFNGSGVATVSVNYADVGNTRLNARYLGSGADAGLVMDGMDSFVAYPAGLCVSSAGQCNAADMSCSVFAKAGESFPLSITAVAWEADGDTNFCSGNVGTPSYQNSAATISSVAIAPASANSQGSVFPVSYSHTRSYDSGTGTGGTNTVAVTESEVGVFRFDVSAPAYQGHALGTYSSAPVGRFVPDRFVATVVNEGVLAPACSVADAYTYSGRPVYWSVAPEWLLTAVNVAGATTQNYTQGDFLRLSAAGVSIGGPSNDNATSGTNAVLLPVAVDINEGALSVFDKGQLRFVMNPSDTLEYTRSATAEVSPFYPDLTYRLDAVTDLDSVLLPAGIDIAPAANFTVRFGRLWLENGYGSEVIDLTMRLRTEYFDSGRYVPNSDDYCTSWTTAQASVVASGPATLVQASAGTMSAGSTDSAGISLQAPSDVAGTPDTGDVLMEYTAPAWLTGDYDNDGVFGNPQGTASFGVYRGHDKVIYRRELR